MDFSFTTAHPAPVPVTINGKTYQVPRYLLPEFKSRAAEHRRRIVQEATAHLDADAKARFLVYYAPPPIDTATVARELLTPAGIDELLRRQFKAAGVPEGDVDGLLASADPAMLHALASELSSAQQAAREQEQASGDGEGTPESPPSADGGLMPTSAASDTTISATSPRSPERTPA